MDIFERIAKIRDDSGDSQEKFAARIGLSRNFINQVENRKKNVSDRTIADIVKIFGVNEEWLRYGKGEPYIQRSKDEEIAEMLMDIQLGGEDSFRHRLISALANLDEAGWNMLEQLIDDIVGNKKAGD